ncbi:Beta-glucosidase 11 [Bienertia sinuspersici]
MRKWVIVAWLQYFVLLNLRGNIVVGVKHYNRYEFPLDFIFGAATSAYQVEGAASEDGRTPSIFDTIAHVGQIAGDGDVACDEYHKYKEDVQLMVETGLDAYRFSISWSRLIPNGRGPVNPEGLEYYNNLINELISHGIQPHVTLMHSDSPQVLEDEYGGFLSQRIIEDFTAYVDVCFREFGDRVKYWTTFNEANIFALGGYDVGSSPPARCSFPFGFVNCTAGNSTTEPYSAAHNILLAHASAAMIYKERYQDKQHGFIGFNLFSYHFLPLRNTTEDVLAAQRSYSFLVGWFMHPLLYGDYPEIMKTNTGTRIPRFTSNQSELLKGSIDFIGLNYYTVMYVKHTKLMPEPRDYIADRGGAWFCQVTDYNVMVNDSSRVEYIQAHIGGVLDAVRNGSNTKGYFVWSFLDVFELLFGYEYTYGLYYVDFNDPNLPRFPKLSQNWYSGFLKGNDVRIDEDIKVMDTSNILIDEVLDAEVGFVL